MILAALVIGAIFVLFPSAVFGTDQPTISSNQADYQAGSLVKLDGTNWTNDSTVTIFVDDANGHTWQHTADVTVAPDGSIHDEFNLPLDFIANYSVTATGDQSNAVATTSFTDAAGANLDQCANGDIPRDSSCPSVSNSLDGDWQNGDLNSNNSHFREGDSVPFRIVFSGLSSANSVTISWQATNTPAQHAYDYLTTWNRTVTSADPCDGVSGCVLGSPSSTFSIPTDPTLAAGCGFTGSQIAGAFTMWGGTITSVSAYGLSGCAPTSANTDNSITINFTASTPDPVLAWGGHIASSIDWGQGHSASAISGSPYHMALDSCSFNCGAQDRALQASGVLPEPSIVTQVSSTTATVGVTSITDQATLTGPNGTVTGSVKFLVCGPTGSATPCVSGGADAGTKTLSGGVATSDGFTPTAAGTYCFRAEYTPDANAEYSPSVSSVTTNECFTAVNKVNPTDTTAIHEGANDTGGTTAAGASEPIGTTVHDSAHVTGTAAGGTPTGSVTFSVWLGRTTCPDPAVTAPDFTATVSLDASGNADPALSKVVPVGGLAYQATYNGSTTYNTSTSDCEPLSASKLNSTTVTVVHNAAHTPVTSALIGSTVHDKVSVTGTAGGGTPAGTVDFQVWLGNTTCSGNASASETGDALNSSGIFDGALPETVPMGGLSYKAHYNGSTTYNPSDGACEPLAGAFNALTPGYWKNHMANSNSKGPFYSTDCKNISKYGGSCSTNGPWVIQYLPKSLGNFSVSSIIIASQVFQAMNCSSTKPQDAIGCLAGHLLASKLNLANGSPAFPCILQTVADADAFLQGQTVNGVPGINYTGPSGKYTLTAAQRALAVQLKTTLDNYNNGSLSC